MSAHESGQDVTIERYVNPETIGLALSGFVAGAGAGFIWWAAKRARFGAAPFGLAVLVASSLANRSDWPRWSSVVALGLALTMLAGEGAVGLLARPDVTWGWVAAGALVSAVGVWAGVPEVGPALVVGGCFAGLMTAAVVTGASWAPSAGVGMAALLAWAAQSGAAGRPWASVGGALCTGISPWLAIRQLLPGPRWSRSPGPWWLLGAHIVLVSGAARWIAVVPHPGWHRVAMVAVAGLAVAMATRPRA